MTFAGGFNDILRDVPYDQQADDDSAWFFLSGLRPLPHVPNIN